MRKIVGCVTMLVIIWGIVINNVEVFATTKKNSNPLNVLLLNQLKNPHLYNGCEITSLTMMLNYNGIKVDKLLLSREIAKVPLTYPNGLKGDPYLGFVGDMVNGPGLAVYHKPIYNLAKKYVGDLVQDLTGKSISEVYKKIDQGSPVWVITTTKFTRVNNFVTWNTPQGKIKVTFSEHSVLVTGYSKNYVYVNNPYGYKNQKVNRKKFESSWIQMGKQAVVINKKIKK